MQDLVRQKIIEQINKLVKCLEDVKKKADTNEKKEAIKNVESIFGGLKNKVQ